MSVYSCPSAGPDAFQSITRRPPDVALICRINLTTVTSRPLHAVLLPQSAGQEMLAALAAALDGSGPAILPLDPSLAPGAITAACEAFGPAAIRTMKATRPAPASAQRLYRDPPGVAAGTAVVIATSGSTGSTKGAELSSAALTASASPSLRRIGARAAHRGA